MSDIITDALRTAAEEVRRASDVLAAMRAAHEDLQRAYALQAAELARLRVPPAPHPSGEAVRARALICDALVGHGVDFAVTAHGDRILVRVIP